MGRALRSPALSICLPAFFAGSCALSAPAPDEPRAPWATRAAGGLALALKPGLFTLYGIDGDFTAETPAKGTLEESDSGDLVGRFGLALRAEYAWSSYGVAFLGAEYRVYDIEGLNPIQDLDVSVETVDSMQYSVGVRGLLPALESLPRWRPYGELSVIYLPDVDVGFEVDLSRFGSSNLEIDTQGEGYWMGAISAGALYAWTEHLSAEIGLVYEVPITEMDTDLSFSIGSSTVPMFGELAPRGLVGFCGLTWTF